MDINFYIPRGCYYLVQGGGTPYWKVSGLDLAAPAWISSVQISTRDNIATIPCFNGIKVAAIIGDNFGRIYIRGKALLGSNAMRKFEGGFNSSGNALRASSSFTPVTLSSKGGASYRFLLEDVGIDGFEDEERHILNFHLGGYTI